MPIIRQVFIGAGALPNHPDGLAFERKLYVIRRRVENAIRESDVGQAGHVLHPFAVL